VCARDLYKEADVFLDANENAFGSAIELADASLNRYPDSDCTALRKAIADYCGTDAENVIAGNGSDEVISMAVATFAGEGDNIVTVQPDYAMYGVSARIAGASERQVLLAEEFALEVPAILQAVDARTKIIFLSSPNAGSGAPIEENAVRQLLCEFDGLVFVDEAYYEFCGKTLAPLVSEYDNLLVSRTLSKAWGLAGLRVGYGIAPKPVIAAMRKVKPPYNIGTLNAQIATAAILTGRQRMEQNVRQTLEEKERLSARLACLGLEVLPGVANFIVARFPSRLSSKKVQAVLAQGRIVVRDRSSLPLLENCIRFTVGTPAENNAMLAALEKIMVQNE
jgi:histidinol-phosphate aminotransferase